MAIVYMNSDHGLGCYCYCIAEKLLTPDAFRVVNECVWIVPGTVEP